MFPGVENRHDGFKTPYFQTPGFRVCLVHMASGINFSLRVSNQTPMNILLIVGCFISAYGLFALIAFRIVKLLFPNTNEDHHKRWRVKTPEA